MRKRRRTRKPIGKTSSISDKERRMRRERERLDRPYYKPEKRSPMKAVNGIIGGFGYAIAMLVAVVFAIVFLFFMLGAIGFFATH